VILNRNKLSAIATAV